MKALILAAGQGTRLAPYTDNCPKGLIKLGGKPIVSYTLDNFKGLGIDNISIVTGYKSEMFKFKDVNYVCNDRYNETNMVYSLFCAEHLMNDDLIISYGDIVFEPHVVKSLLESEGDISVVVDDDWLKLWKLRSDNPLEDAETLILDNVGNIKEIGAAAEGYEQIESQYIGLMKFSKKGLEKLKEIYEGLKSGDGQKIIRGRGFHELYMTDILQLIIDSGIKVKSVRISGGWIEIDSRNDYELYRDMYETGQLIEYCNINSIRT